MKTYPFMQVDAFTTQALGGNPCAVFFDSADMSDELMLAITREMNFSEFRLCDAFRDCRFPRALLHPDGRNTAGGAPDHRYHLCAG